MLKKININQIQQLIKIKQKFNNQKLEKTVIEKENLIKNLNCQIEDNKQIILSKNELFAEMRSKYEVMSNQIQSIEREKGEFKEVDFIIEF